MNAPAAAPPLHLAAKQPVNFLLVVWGRKYIEQFLRISLPSLLAPGNIPAMAGHYACTFTVLTQSKDREAFTGSPLFKKLKPYCAVRFIDISDLIFGGNYSATITLAYERGMRMSKERMCETYFIYLVSDYIMADGSLRNLSRYMEQGYSGITAGNFQIIEEKCKKVLPKIIHPQTGVLSIAPRELMAFGLKNLHPMTIANTVNQDICHSLHSNRLFWRVDNHTLIGRFYLRHMICIRPEVDNYVIGSSCDYSFIDEMCPSGRVFHINDSDDYCVVELQPASHEQHFIKHGPLEHRQLVKELAEWTTAQHRANAHAPVLFHSRDLPEKLDTMLKESAAFISSVEAKLPKKSKPARGHYYWVSCIASIYEKILQRHNQDEYYRNGVFAGVHGSQTFSPPIFGKEQSARWIDYPLLSRNYFKPRVSCQRRFWNRFLHLAGGKPPKVYPWHRSWLDYKRMLAFIRPALEQHSCLYISSGLKYMADWLYENHKEHMIFQKLELFLARSPAQLQSSLGPIQSIIIHTHIHSLNALNLLIPHCLQIMPQGGSIYLLCHYHRHNQFKDFFASRLPTCLDDRVSIGFVRYNTHPFRRSMDALLEHTLGHMPQYKRSPLRLAIALARMATLGGVYTLGNLLALLDTPQWLPATSALARLDVVPEATDQSTAAGKPGETPYYPKQQAIG